MQALNQTEIFLENDDLFPRKEKTNTNGHDLPITIQRCVKKSLHKEASTSSKDTGVKPGPSKQFKVDNTSKWFNVWFPLNITFITIQSAIRDNNKHIWHVILPLTPHMIHIAYHEQNLLMIIIARWYLIHIAYPEQNLRMIIIARWYLIQIAYHEQNFGMINIAHSYIWHPTPYLVIYRYRPSMHQEKYC